MPPASALLTSPARRCECRGRDGMRAASMLSKMRRQQQRSMARRVSTLSRSRARARIEQCARTLPPCHLPSCMHTRNRMRALTGIGRGRIGAHRAWVCYTCADKTCHGDFSGTCKEHMLRTLWPIANTCGPALSERWRSRCQIAAGMERCATTLRKEGIITPFLRSPSELCTSANCVGSRLRDCRVSVQPVK